jgi:prevent-host-death family protein
MIHFTSPGVDFLAEVDSMTYSVQDAREHLSEILEKVRSGERVLIAEEGSEVAEIRSVHQPVPADDALRRLEGEGLVTLPADDRPSLAEVLRELEEEWRVDPPKPGGLARFLESRG